MAIKDTVFVGRAVQNAVQTTLLVVALLGIVGSLGWCLAGKIGLAFMIFAGLFTTFISSRLGPFLIFRMYRGKKISPQSHPGLYKILIALSRKAGLVKVPTLWYIPSETCNAFATGHGKYSAIGITDGILKAFDHEEVAAILAHEISHIMHKDTRVMGIADLASRITSSFSKIGLLLLVINLPMTLMGGEAFSWPLIGILILAPNLTALLQLGLSRTREYAADREAARLTGNPRALARALRKLEEIAGANWEQIVRPGHKVPAPSILRTHPKTEDRIARLLELEKDEPEVLAAPPRPALPASYRPYPAKETAWQPPQVPPVRRPAWHGVSGLYY